MPRASGKYRPSQVRTQKAGPDPLEATGRGGGAGKRIGEEIRLRRGLALLLSLPSAEQETEQVFGRRYARRERKGSREHGDGNKHHAAPHALI